MGVENLVECVRGSNEIGSRGLIDQIMASADAFAAGAEQHDDMTIVVAPPRVTADMIAG